MFKSKIKEFQNNWLYSVQELKRDAEGLIEWFLIQENHESNKINSVDIQTRLTEIQSAVKVFETQIIFLKDQQMANERIIEVTQLLEQLDDYIMFGVQDSSNMRLVEDANVNVDLIEIIEAPVLTSADVQKVFHMPYKNFIEQIQEIHPAAKHYAYIGLLKSYLIDIKNMKIFNFSYLAELADSLSYIPDFAARGFDQLDDNAFWYPIFKSRNHELKYFLEVFLSAVAGYNRWLHKKQNESWKDKL